MIQTVVRCSFSHQLQLDATDSIGGNDQVNCAPVRPSIDSVHSFDSPPALNISYRNAMPHSTRSRSNSRAPSQSRTSNLRSINEGNGETTEGTEKFPDFDSSSMGSAVRSQSPRKPNGYTNGYAPASDRWLPRRESQSRGVRWGASGASGSSHGHGRQKSISDAFHNIRNRGGSMSHNAHEIADALRAPVSAKLIVCSNPPLSL